MRATIKATKNFLANPFSTKSGMKRAKAKTIQTLKERFGIDTDITDDEVESLANFFEDSDVNKSTNYVEGSDIIAIIEDMREKENVTYEDFVKEMKRYQKYNKGKEIAQLRNIYRKYINTKKGSNADILLGYIKDSIDEATTSEELDDLEEYIKKLLDDGLMKKSEYNHFMNLIEEKRQEVT